MRRNFLYIEAHLPPFPRSSSPCTFLPPLFQYFFQINIKFIDPALIPRDKRSRSPLWPANNNNANPPLPYQSFCYLIFCCYFRSHPVDDLIAENRRDSSVILQDARFASECNADDCAFNVKRLVKMFSSSP